MQPKVLSKTRIVSKKIRDFFTHQRLISAGVNGHHATVILSLEVGETLSVMHTLLDQTERKQIAGEKIFFSKIYKKEQERISKKKLFSRSKSFFR